MPPHATFDAWIAAEAIAFPLASPDAAVDALVSSLGSRVELLGLGEPTHGGETFLALRNRVFQRLATAHGYTAIAVESSFPRGRLVNDYVLGRAAVTSYDALIDAGFSHGFGKTAANRELVEWMRQWNADPAHANKLHFYGFDAPTEMTGAESPRQLLDVALNHLHTIDPELADTHRATIESHLGDDADWSNPAAAFDASQSIGSRPIVNKLRVATKHLSTALQQRSDDSPAHLEAIHAAGHAQQMLSYHVRMARASEDRTSELLGLRDAMMADNLVYALNTERRRGGKVLAFAHTMHLKRGQSVWQWGADRLAWWPAGEHVWRMLEDRYAVVGVGMTRFDAYQVGDAEPGTLEAMLSPEPAHGRLIVTRRGEGLPSTEDLPTRAANPRYFPFDRPSVTALDAVLMVGEVEPSRTIESA